MTDTRHRAISKEGNNWRSNKFAKVIQMWSNFCCVLALTSKFTASGIRLVAKEIKDLDGAFWKYWPWDEVGGQLLDKFPHQSYEGAKYLVLILIQIYSLLLIITIRNISKVIDFWIRSENQPPRFSRLLLLRRAFFHDLETGLSLFLNQFSHLKSRFRISFMCDCCCINICETIIITLLPHDRHKWDWDAAATVLSFLWWSLDQHFSVRCAGELNDGKDKKPDTTFLN